MDGSNVDLPLAVLPCTRLLKKEFEDTKGVIRIRKSKKKTLFGDTKGENQKP